MKGRNQGRRAAVAAAVVLAAVGCSSKAGGDDSSAPSAAGEVRTGVGIEGNTITLGVLTDLTGVFAPIGKDVNAGQQLFWDTKNAAGGVCGRYQVELDVNDHGYNVQTATSLYSGMKSNALALQLLLGSPMTTALADRLQQDELLTVSGSGADNLTDNPYLLWVGTTYDLEMVNGLDYLLAEGLISKGATLGHIYIEGEYGASGLAGSTFFAEANGMRLVEHKITAADQDMTAAVIALKAAGAQAILLTTTPTQTASAVTAAASQGLDVPVLGNSPTFAAGLMDTPARQALLDNFYLAQSYAGFDNPEARKALDLYSAENPDAKPGFSLAGGYATALVMSQILEKACADGDLTRQGLFDAKKGLTNIETTGLTGPLDYSQPGVSPGRQTYVLRPDVAAPGGASVVQTLTEGVTAATYTRGG